MEVRLWQLALTSSLMELHKPIIFLHDVTSTSVHDLSDSMIMFLSSAKVLTSEIIHQITIGPSTTFSLADLLKASTRIEIRKNMKFQVLFLFCFFALQSTTKARTVGVQTLGDYTHESIQDIDGGPITHTFLGPDGFNRTIVTGPDVNSVSSLSDASGVTFTISAPDGSQMQIIGPLKSKGISNVVSSSSSISDIKIIGQSSGSNSGSDADSEVFEISPPNARVFDPCFPFCTEEILLVREPTRPHSRPPTDQPPPPPPPPPSKAPPPPPVVIVKSFKTGTEKPSPAANILRTCFPFCDPN